jgi:hypothetical protein
MTKGRARQREIIAGPSGTVVSVADGAWSSGISPVLLLPLLEAGRPVIPPR